MAARFLIAYPPRKPKVYSEAVVDPETEKKWALLIEKLLNQHRIQKEVVTLRLSSEAKAIAVCWLDQHNQEQAAEIGDMAAAYSKLEQIPSDWLLDYTWPAVSQMKAFNTWK